MRFALFALLTGAALALEATTEATAAATTEEAKGVSRFNRHRGEHAGGQGGERRGEHKGEAKEGEQKEGEHKGERKPCPKGAKHSPSSILHKVVYDAIFESGLIDHLGKKLAFFSAGHARHFEKKENKEHKLKKHFGKPGQEKESEEELALEESHEEEEDHSVEYHQETEAPERKPEPAAEVKAADAGSAAPEAVVTEAAPAAPAATVSA